MSMNKRERLSLTLAVIVNIIIVLLIPSYKLEDVIDKKLKVGLVAFEKTKVSQKKTERQKDFKKDKEIAEKDAAQKIVENKKREQEKAKKKSLALNSLSKTIKTPDFVNINTAKESQRKVGETGLLQSIKSVKNNVKFEKEDKIGLDTEEIKFNDAIKSDELVHQNNENLFIFEDKEGLKESIKIDNSKTEGLPSGYKLGVEDGDIVAKWDKSNKEPVYPESAELKGLQGTVRVKLDVNERGDVINLTMDKGSGVPEINSAIESIGRTWKIYLSKHGLSIKGRVILEYTFKLKGGI